MLLGKAAQLAAQGGQLKASPASPMPASSSAPAAGEAKTVGAGLKITLGGIKLAGTTVAAGAESADGAGAGGKKPKRPKMDKSFDYMVGDVLGSSTSLFPPFPYSQAHSDDSIQRAGRISQPHPSSHPSSSLLYLISNPDPAPCPPIHPLDPSQLRDAFTLKQGGLSGFDMSLWEGRGGEKGGGRKVSFVAVTGRAAVGRVRRCADAVGYRARIAEEEAETGRPCSGRRHAKEAKAMNPLSFFSFPSGCPAPLVSCAVVLLSHRVIVFGVFSAHVKCCSHHHLHCPHAHHPSPFSHPSRPVHAARVAN